MAAADPEAPFFLVSLTIASFEFYIYCFIVAISSFLLIKASYMECSACFLSLVFLGKLPLIPRNHGNA